MRRTTFVASAVLAVAAGYATAQTAPASVLAMTDLLMDSTPETTAQSYGLQRRAPRKSSILERPQGYARVSGHFRD